MKFHVFFIACSTNKTLQTLSLSGNQIGDAGAGSIGGALTYVQSRHPKMFNFGFYTFGMLAMWEPLGSVLVLRTRNRATQIF
jgi:hypothetical protein